MKIQTQPSTVQRTSPTQRAVPKSAEEMQALLASLQAQAAQLQDFINDLVPSDGKPQRAPRGATRGDSTRIDTRPAPVQPQEIFGDGHDDEPFVEEEPPPPPPPPPVRQPDLRERIQLALTRESLDTARLAKTVNETIEKVSNTLRTLRGEGHVYNVGFEDNAIWTWKVGNDVDTATLIRVVRRLISERPMFLRDLVRATGAKESRVSGALIEVQRMDRVADLSAGGHAKQYFLIGDRVRDVSLPPKKVRGVAVKHGTRRGGGQ